MFKKASKKLSVLLAVIMLASSFISFLTPFSVMADGVYANDLFFSEYIEGSSNNKAIEIFNGTAQTVDLSQYTVELYSNGATAPGNSFTLSGTLESGKVYIIANSSAVAAIKDISNATATVTYFNGDDALLLKHNGTVIDSFGIVGQDPGSYWGTATDNTTDHTLVRKSTITQGDADAADDFDPAVQWVFLEKDDFSNLGKHTMDGFGQPGPQKVAAVTASHVGAVAVGTEVALSTSTEGAAIYYRVNDNTEETLYTAPIVINEAVIIRAIARKAGLTDSDEAVFEYTIKPVAQLNTIAEARAAALGSAVIVEGAVTTTPGAFGGKQFYLQDATGGALIYTSSLSVAVARGNIIRVTGTTAEYQGKFEILPSSIEIIDAGTLDPAAKTVLVADINEANEGVLVQIKNVTVAEITSDTYKNAYLKVIDGENFTTVKVDSRTGMSIENLTIKVQDVISVVGVVEQGKASPAEYRVLIRDAGDLAVSTPPDTVPPVINHTPITSGSTGADLMIRTSVTDNLNVSTVKLYYRTIGDTSFKTAVMAAENSEYIYAIPKAELTAAGLEYYIEASDGTNTVTSPEDIASPYNVNITVQDLTGPQVTALTPANGAYTGSVLKPTISVNYTDDSGIDIASVRLYLDGQEITGQCTLNAQSVSFTPSVDLAKGQHDVRMVVSDKAVPANTTDISWTFYVGAPTFNFYYGQLHSHTGEISDGQGTLDEAYRWARDVGKADFFAVTDHSNWFDGEKDLKNETITSVDQSTSAEWKKMNTVANQYNEDGKFAAIAGFEMTWSGSTGGWGHINTFNTPWFASRSNSSMGLKPYYDKIAQSTDSISQLNHPGKTFGDFGDFGFYTQATDNVVHLIEVGNGEGPIRGSGYFPSYEYYTRALDKGWHVAPSNNQDNHKANWITSNEARTVVLAPYLTRESVYEAIRKLRVYSTEDKNLQITYKVNDQIMGSSLDNPTKLNFSILVNDPDSMDKIAKISIISNGGVIAEQKTFDSNTAAWEFQLDPKYSYYYVRVEQTDKDIAVTAPIWTSAVTPVGISKVEVAQDPVIVNTAVNVSATVYNNGTTPLQDVTVEFYKNEITAVNKIGDAMIASVASGGTGIAALSWTPDKVGEYKIYAKTVIKVDNTEKVYTESVSVSIVNKEDIVKVVLDAGHYNQYVSGDYAGKMLTLTQLLKDKKIMLVVNQDELTAEDLTDAKLLIMTDPQSKDDTKYNLFKSKYSPAEIAVIANFVNQGNSVIITSRADYNDKGVTDASYQSAAQGNVILEAIGSNVRFNDDEVIDKTSNGGQEYRLYFNKYSSPLYDLTQGVTPDVTYSFYSGCSIILKPGADESKVEFFVKGHDTTEILDSDLQGDATPVTKGAVNAVAAEVLPSGAKVIVAGTTFFSDFETASADAMYSNLQITENVIGWMIQPKQAELKNINELRVDANNDGVPDMLGRTFMVKGRVTAESEAYTKANNRNNAFFEVIYVQDQTGGITVFGVSQKEIPLGAEVMITGWVDEYDGDLEMQIRNEATDVIVLDTPNQPVMPKEVTTGDSMQESNEGILVKVRGIVKRMTENALYIDDGTGEARIYVNGYIGDGTTNPEMMGKWDPNIKLGDIVSAVGLVSQDPEGHRLRVRNTAEIERVAPATPPVITISGVMDGTVYTTAITPVVTVDKGTFTMQLNGSAYSGGTITQEGMHILTVTAVDQFGLTSAATVRFTIDKTGPVITMNIKNGAILERWNTFSIINNTTDAITGVKSIETRLDGIVISNNSILNLETLSFGKHIITITAVDKAGNTAVSKIDFTITATYSTLQKLLERFNKAGEFKARGLYQSLQAKLKTKNLNMFITYVKAQAGKNISEKAAYKLLEYANWINKR